MENNIQDQKIENDLNQDASKDSLRHSVVMVIIIASLFGAIFGFISGSIMFSLSKEYPLPLERIIGINDQRQKDQRTEDNEDVTAQKDSLVIEAVDKASPAVVSIVITKDVPKFRRSFNSPFDFFFNPFGEQGSQETERRQIGGGTGFVIAEDGVIVTNKHVVQDVEASYTVIANDEKEYPAKVIARHPSLDIAIIKIEVSGFPVLELGDSDKVKVGQSVLAIGNSLGEFANSVNLGIVSGLKRNVIAGSSATGESERLSNIIQTDAAINPGNSGGPLLDLYGRVVGVNVAMAQGAQNIGFAIPINQVSKMIDQVQNTGKVSVPFLGVRYVQVDQEMKEQNNLPFDYGVIVIRGDKLTDLAVVPGSPADKAGLVENDIILEADGVKIDMKNELATIIASHDVGDMLVLKVWHKGEQKKVEIKLEERK